MIKEQFLPIKGYEGYYSISNLGRLKSDRYNRIIKPKHHRNGYLLFELHKDGFRKTYTAHRLVALTFIPNPENLPQVNHIDEDKTNNRVSNLEWCTAEYNTNYGTRNERAAEAKAKSISQYDQNGNWIATYSSITEAARLNNLWQGSISNAASGKLFTTGGYIWRYN